MSDLPTGSGVDLIVEDFKCLRNEHRFELRGLTVLAGANSSGKSSAVQPALLLKQTLQASIDPPGALQLRGPLVEHTTAQDLLWRRSKTGSFAVGLGVAGRETVSCLGYSDGRLTVPRCTVTVTNHGAAASVTIEANHGTASAKAFLDAYHHEDVARHQAAYGPTAVSLIRSRFSLVALAHAGGNSLRADPWSLEQYLVLAKLLHVPGLRGNPERDYPLAEASLSPMGPFARDYAAGFLLSWQDTADSRYAQLADQLLALELTGHVEATRIGDVSVSILVGRLPSNGRKTKDLVNIADVGFGVSQVLPVLVALLAAEPGQIVHLEQPELHLHPEAQARLGQVIVEAVRRGVLVILETHSPLLLLAIQIALASGEVAPELVRLYWFERDAKGAAKVTPGRLDEHGRYDQWPVDFWEVERQRYGQYVHTFMQAPGQAAE